MPRQMVVAIHLTTWSQATERATQREAVNRPCHSIGFKAADL